MSLERTELSTATDIAAARREGRPYYTIGKIKFSQTKIDPRVQREVNTIEANAIGAEFDKTVLGTITVSVRANGDNVLLDGLQRKSGAEIANFDDPVDCIFHYNLTLEQEAEKFRRLNYRTSVNSVAAFKVAVTEGIPEALAVQDILSKFGITIGGKGNFQAVKTALRIVTTPGGAEDLRWALNMVIDAWDLARSGRHIDGKMVEALALMHHRYKGQIDTASLRDRLAARRGGQPGLMGEARTRQPRRGGKLVIALIDALVDEYNFKRPKNKLPEWPR